MTPYPLADDHILRVTLKYCQVTGTGIGEWDRGLGFVMGMGMENGNGNRDILGWGGVQGQVKKSG